MSSTIGDKTEEILASMTLEEKCSLLSGQDFWNLQGIQRLGLDPVMVTDGPHGLRKQTANPDHLGLSESVPATCFPTAVTLASSWDTALLERVGSALADECLAENVSVLLGPGMNIKRSPLCGRNFEYFSEDPYASGHMAAALIRGIQSKGVGACIKHFAANNQEFHRFVVDAIVDERSLRELYLAGFEIAVKESQPWTVMCSYNQVNGHYSSDNHWLMTEVLRNEWGFDGLVMTDWGAMNDRVAGVLAGLDLEMPSSGGVNDRLIQKAVEDGQLDESAVDRILKRTISLVLRSMENKKTECTVDLSAAHELAREVAENSMVLLKNHEEILPLSRGEKIAVIGALAEDVRYQGAGSSEINPFQLDIPLEEVRNLNPACTYAQGYSTKDGDVVDGLIAEAVEIAKAADTLVVFLGLTRSYESEGFDREHMELPLNQTALMDALIALGKPIIVVLSNGSPVEMPWIDSVSGVLESYLGGQGGGKAISRILFGEANPSGKLAETFPLEMADNPSYGNFPGTPQQVQYREGLYVGYRYYESAGQPVLFPFGHGLSYTKFEYSDLHLSSETFTPNGTITVSCRITNTGKKFGKEVVQIYVSDRVSTVYRPKSELKGFSKVALEPGESKIVTFTLDDRSFAVWDVSSSSWKIEAGEFGIKVGASSQDIRLTGSINAISDWQPEQDAEALAVYKAITPDFSPDSFAFATLLGKSIPTPRPLHPFTRNSTLEELSTSFFAGRIAREILNKMTSQFTGGASEGMNLMMVRMMRELPIRAVVLLGGGVDMNYDMVDGIVRIANGQLLTGFLKLRKGRNAL